MLFPVIEIIPPKDPRPARRLLSCLGNFDLAIFVSANAATAALELVPDLSHRPPRLQIGAIGKATAEALTAAGVRVDVIPRCEFRIEALLRLDALQELHGQKVLIVRGMGGREELANALQARGAQVNYAEVYQRRRTRRDPRALIARWGRGQIDAVTATSSELLSALVAVLRPALEEIRRTPLVVFSERTASEARTAHGFAHVLVAPEASDAGIVQALKAWRASAPRDPNQPSSA